MASIELKNLTKRFGSVAAVDGVSLRIEHGRVVCVLGPSGCGKTTMLRTIAGFVEPTAGEIYVGEKLMSSPSGTVPPEKRNMSMIFQSYALWPHMTVAENVAYGLKLRKLDRDTINVKLACMLGTTKLTPFASRYPGELSGGQQQRVALARALIVEPETLLLDEPLSNLDANLREEMRFEVRRLHDSYRYTTVYVTHDQSEAMTAADVICVMNHGKVEQMGTPQEIYDQPRSEFVARFIGAANVLKGKNAGTDGIEVAGATLRINGTQANGATAISIRQHDIVISKSAPGGDNVLPARVARQVFLGASRDYLVQLNDGTQLRVAAPPTTDIEQGSEVFLSLPAVNCRALAG